MSSTSTPINHLSSLIKDRVDELYDQSGYSDKYGLHLWIVITLAFLVLFASAYYYVLNHLQPIKANWNEEKCNPAYMPFAGVIHDKKGDDFYKFTADNFTGCTQTILQKITDYAFLPFYYAMNVMSNVFLAMVNALGAMREMFDKMRNSASYITAIIFDRIFNITAPILEMFINIKSMAAKFVGMVTTVVFSLLSAYLGLQSFVGIIIKLIRDILYIIVGIIVALIILSWIPGIFPIAVALGAGFSVLLALVVMLQLQMKNVMNIHSGGLPSNPI
jgi:hypothetical protein